MKKTYYSNSALSSVKAKKKPGLPIPFDKVSLASIRSGLKMPSFGLILFLIGFNGMFFLPYFFPQALFADAQAGTYRYYFLSWLLIFAGGVFETATSNFWLLRRKPLWSLLLITVISLMLLRGVLNGESILSAVSKSFPFYWLLLLPAIGLRKQNWPWLWLTFLFHALLGSVYFLNSSFIQGATSRGAIIEYEGQNFLLQSLYMAWFLFLMMPAMKGQFLKGIAWMLFIFSFLQSLFFFLRLDSFLSLVQLLLVGFVFLRTSKVNMIVQRVFVGGIIFIILLIPLVLTLPDSGVGQEFSSTIGQAYNGLMDRTLKKGSFSDTVEEDLRWLETRLIVASMNTEDWILGKGLSARWSHVRFANGEQRYMSHNTLLNAFYWGGGFLFLVIASPFIWIIRVFLRSRNASGLGSAAYLVLVYFTFLFFLVTRTSQEWVLFCVVLGVCVWHEAALSESRVGHADPRHLVLSPSKAKKGKRLSPET